MVAILDFPSKQFKLFFYIKSLQCSLPSFNWPFGSGEEAKNIISRRLSWISDGNDFSYLRSTNHPDAPYQVSSQLAQGVGGVGFKSNLLTPHEARRTLTDHISSLLII